MSDFICQLKLPAGMMSVLVIVWCTAQIGKDSQANYFPPSHPELFNEALAISIPDSAAAVERYFDEEQQATLSLEP